MLESSISISTKPQHKYKILEVLGEGCFGKVAKGCNQFTKELVMLGLIKELEPDVFNIVEFIEHFEHDGQQCMAFEMLDESVHNLLNQEFSFSLNEIRPMAKQLLTALLGLQSVGVLHSDIKPDNIMLVDHAKQPFKVKLIDFGVARHISEVRLGTIIQPIGYRAPEVTLGLPLSEAVDVWALACCLALWYLGWHNLTSLSEYDNLTMIVDILGLPANELLNMGIHTSQYFVQEDSKWRLKTLQEYKDSTGTDPKMYGGRETTTLEELIKVPFEFQLNIECSDKEAFYDLLKKMFEMNPKKRITPVEALLHPFITMSHLPQGTCYTEVALQYMSVAETDFEPLTDEEESMVLSYDAGNGRWGEKSPGEITIGSLYIPSGRHTSEGSDINESGTSSFSSGLIATSNSSGYLSTDEEESMGLSYEVGNGRWGEKSPGEITIGSLYIPSGLNTTEKTASELVHEEMSTVTHPVHLVISVKMRNIIFTQQAWGHHTQGAKGNHWGK
uniref:Protein kinase domain-containing protein n=1 Tax=Neogobius melanostomus TaxID=47308 RepID=A0A8C6T0K1_9GOBI